MARINLNNFIHFEAVARLSRINLAAEELCMSPSAVSQQIRVLENDLGVSLFRRIKRRLVLTKDGERLYSVATRALEMLGEVRNEVGRTRARSNLFVRLPPGLSLKVLNVRLFEFARLHPDFSIRFDATTDVTDFEKEIVDLHIRHDIDPPAGLFAELLFHDAILPVCTPSIRDRARMTGIEATLRETPLIDSTKARFSWSRWLTRNNLDPINRNVAAQLSRGVMSIDAAARGGGIALGSVLLMLDELESGTLVPLAPQLGVIEYPAYYFLCPAQHLNRRAVHSFLEWIKPLAVEIETRKKSLLLGLGCLPD